MAAFQLKNHRERSERSPGVDWRPRAALAAAVGLAVGLFMRSARPDAAPQPDGVVSIARAAHSPAAPGRSLVQHAPSRFKRDVAAAWERASSDEDQSFREQQSVELVDLLTARVRLVDGALAGNPEAVANHLRLYQLGMVEALMRTAPELTGELAKQVQRALCDPKAGDSQLMIMARLAGDVPDLATPEGFDCIFKTRGKEDIVLWTALDSWKESGMPRPDGLDQVERYARDQRTKDRLNPALAVSDTSEEERLVLNNYASKEPPAPP